MEGIAIGAIALVFAIGLAGGLVGARMRRGEQPAADRELRSTLEQLAAWARGMHAEHESLRARVAALEAHPQPVSASPPEVAGEPHGSAIYEGATPQAAPDFALQTYAMENGSAPGLQPDGTLAASTAPIERPESGEPAPERASARTAEPPQPNWFTRWLFGGNTVVRVGIVILFFGVAFLLKYAYERVHVPIELRLTGVALLAVALLVLGWRLRDKRAGYAQALQGGGVGVLYLTVFAALRLYQLIPPGAAMVLLIGIAAFSAALALLQNSRSLALLGTSGGFLAPVLASTGSGSHIMLFSYYALLNAGVLAIALKRAWRELNLAGFAFTFLIGATWGARFYRPELFASTEPFLVLFFLMYVAVPVLYARHQAVALRVPVDATLIFGTPLAAFGLQHGLVREFEYGAAFSAALLAAFYLVLAGRLLKRANQSLRLLVEAFFALGVVFATLAVPLAFEGRWTSAVWALEAAAILWIGVRQQRLPARLFAVLLQFGAGTMFLFDLPQGGALPWLNVGFLGCAMVALAGLFSAAYIERHAQRLRPFERGIGNALLIWGALWWAAAGLLQIDEYVGDGLAVHASLAWFALSALALATIARSAQWRGGALLSLAIAPLLLLFALEAVDATSGPLDALGYLAWPFGFAVHLYALRLHQAQAPRAAPWLHATGVWTLAIVAAKTLQWWLFAAVPDSITWADVGIGVAPALLLGALCRAAPTRWPLSEQRAYLLLGGAPLAALLALWTFAANWHGEGSAAPLPYLPIVNPLELTLFAALLLIAWWWNTVHRRGLVAGNAQRKAIGSALWGGLLFAVLNGVLLRSLHHWGGVPWDWDAMLASRLVQSALSIFWTVIALGLMVAATRRGVRSLWLIGAALMAVVVAKLFLIDLSNVGGIERVVSFIGVGVLMLVVGYFAPVPPKAEIAK
ncbi:MAG: DUF2339 domain-containing protein [Sterolibacteriaceae bacterium]|nr:DUF2339 domain-containing protein [Sterolibacteriaceae bacterium]